ncbi:hypothetical protein, partial [Acidihalobacter prosperus]
MKSVRYLMALAAALCLGSANAAALSAGDQYDLQQLLSGNPVSIRAAARNIYHQGRAAPQVLDTVAEIVLERVGEQGRTYVDALSWGCKALARSGNKRYYDAVHKAANDPKANGKLRKYCGRAASDLGGPAGAQYRMGMVSLKGMKANASSAPKAASAPAPAPSGHYKPITVVKAGMSQQEVEALCGPPTSSHSYQTGKAWIPFNFKGSDDYRSVFHYKGQGSITFSNTSAYTSGMRVKEVNVNPSDPGF